MRKYIKSISGVLPCYKVFASLMLFINSHPLPPPTWEVERITKAWIALTREGAAATATGGRNEKSRKTACGFFCFFRLRAKRAGLRPRLWRRRTARNKVFAARMLSKSPHPGPPLEGRGLEGYLRKYIKGMSGVRPCYKEFASLILFLDSHLLQTRQNVGVSEAKHATTLTKSYSYIKVYCVVCLPHGRGCLERRGHV